MLRNFVPGRWLDRRQVTTSTFTALAGTYERNVAVAGGFCCRDAHYFDMRLAMRTPTSRGRLSEYYLDAEPLGELIFVPAGYHYAGEGGPGLQRTLFLFLNADPAGGRPAAYLAAPMRPRECMNLRSERIKMLLTQICRELFDPEYASELLLEGLGVTLQAEVFRLLYHERQREQGRGGLSPVLMRKIREMILAGSPPPSIAELAAACNLSRRHLMRAFRQETGQTVGQYMRQLSMEKARHLLRHSDEPVAAVATAVGFTSVAAFSTAFRRANGDSPRCYRAVQRALITASADDNDDMPE